MLAARPVIGRHRNPVIRQTRTTHDAIDRALLGSAACESCGCSRPTGRACPCCHRMPAMRVHPPVLKHGVMNPAPARYVIRINGHLGATVLSAFRRRCPYAAR